MVPNDSSIDWGKAAAAWASQKREGTIPTPSASFPRPPQHAFQAPLMSHGFSMLNPMGSGGFPMAYSSLLNGENVSATCATPMSGLTQHPRHNTRPAAFLPGGYGMQLHPRPKNPAFFPNQPQNLYGGQLSSSGITSQWLKDSSKAEKTGMDSTSLLPSAETSTCDSHHGSKDNKVEENGSLCHTSSVQCPSTLNSGLNLESTPANAASGQSRERLGGAASCAFPPNSGLLPVGESYVPTISAAPVAAASVASRPSLGSLSMQPSLLPMSRHPSMMAHGQQMHHHHSVQHPLLHMGPAASAPPLHLQLSLPVPMSSRRSYGPPIPDPTLEVDEEILDERDVYDNGGHAFFNYEVKKEGKGETYASNEQVEKELSDVAREGEDYEEPYVRVVTYSKDGQELGNITLNGRKCIIFGSNVKQANVIDSHTSVYSQHCAISCCPKGKPSTKSLYQPCGLFLFSLGGSTKVLKPDQVSFLNNTEKNQEEKPEPENLSEAKTEVEGHTTEAAGSDLTTSSEPPTTTHDMGPTEATPSLSLMNVNKSVDVNDTVEILVDAGRRREIPINTQVYIQLSSSRRYYLIDASHWDVISVHHEGSGELKFRTAGSPTTPKAEQEVVEAEVAKKPRRGKEDRSRSHTSMHRHSRRRRLASADKKRQSSYDKRSTAHSSRHRRSTTRSPSGSRHGRSRHYSSYRRYTERSCSYKSSRYKEAPSRRRHRSPSSHDEYSDSFSRSRRYHHD